MITELEGRYFSLHGGTITIFNLDGFHHGNDWGIGISFTGDENYINCQVEPAPAVEDILDIIEQDKAQGNFEDISMVAVSSRVAVRLFLEGVLQQRDFKRAQEGENEGVGFILLPGCQLGEYVFDLGILPEVVVGNGMIATLDQNYHVVGDESVEPYSLPAKQNLIEVQIDAETGS